MLTFPSSSPCLWDRNQITGETKRAFTRRTSKDILYQNEHKVVSVSKFETFMEPKRLSATVSTTSKNAGLCALKPSVTSWPPLVGQWQFSYVLTAYQFEPHPWIVWPVRWLNGSRCMNGSSFSPSQRAFPFNSKEISSAKCGISSRLTVGPCSAANGDNNATR